MLFFQRMPLSFAEDLLHEAVSYCIDQLDTVTVDVLVEVPLHTENRFQGLSLHTSQHHEQISGLISLDCGDLCHIVPSLEPNGLQYNYCGENSDGNLNKTVSSLESQRSPVFTGVNGQVARTMSADGNETDSALDKRYMSKAGGCIVPVALREVNVDCGDQSHGISQYGVDSWLRQTKQPIPFPGVRRQVVLSSRHLIQDCDDEQSGFQSCASDAVTKHCEVEGFQRTRYVYLPQQSMSLKHGRLPADSTGDSFCPIGDMMFWAREVFRCQLCATGIARSVHIVVFVVFVVF